MNITDFQQRMYRLGVSTSQIALDLDGSTAVSKTTIERRVDGIRTTITVELAGYQLEDILEEHERVITHIQGATN